MHAWSTFRWRTIAWCVLLVLDVAINVVLFLQLHAWSAGDAAGCFTSPASFWSALTSFQDDVLDATLLSLLRAVCFPCLLIFGARLGTPKWAGEQEEYEAKLQRWRQAREQWSSGSLRAAKKRPKAGETNINGDLSASLLPETVKSSRDGSLNGVHFVVHPSLHPSVSWSADVYDDDDDDEEAADEEQFLLQHGPEPVEPLSSKMSLSEKLVQNRVARFRLRATQCFVFVVGIAAQAFLGVKMVGFHFGGEEALKASLLGVSLALANFQSSGLRYLLGVRCGEKGVLTLEVHPHKLYYNEEDVIRSADAPWWNCRCRACEILTSLSVLFLSQQSLRFVPRPSEIRLHLPSV